MRFSPFRQFVTIAVVLAGVGGGVALAQASLYRDTGKPATAEEMGNLAWTTGFSGKDLPPGSGTSKTGAPVFATRCSMCHGKDLEGVVARPETFSPYAGPALGGGNSVAHYLPIGAKSPPGEVTNIAFFVPWSVAIFNIIAYEMPFFNPGTLTPDEVYGLTALVLFKNGLIKEGDVINRETLPKITMPNRYRFPATDAIYMDMKKRGCIETYGVCRERVP